MTLSLDSTAVVDVLRGDHDVRSRFASAVEREEDLVVSSLVLHELSYGAWRSGRADRKLGEIEVLLRRMRVEPFQGEDALEAGRLRAYLADHGGPAGAYDELIAGQALARGWTVVTSNLRHFLRAPDLPVVDWRQSDHPISAGGRAEILLDFLKAKK